MRHSFALSLAVVASTAASHAYAQLPLRTWVSNVGSDLNACSRIEPCLTFTGALAKTAPGGEINVLNAGDFGIVVINKSITIDGGGTLATINVPTGGIGVVIQAGDDDVIFLRNLDIQAMGANRWYGIHFANGKQLIIENTAIAAYNSHGVFVGGGTGAGSLNVVISNTKISSTLIGGPVNGPHAVRVSRGSAFVSHSVITAMGIGLLAENTGVINADSNVLTGNGVAVQAGNGGAGQSAATVRLSNNDVYKNVTGFGCGGGVLASAGNNRKGGNTGGTVPACSPTVPITQQ